ncbi:MAG: hypothetical protein CTY20_06900 [Hyphomicrobium sp.]|nr:MAG: hypothetical protein CTY20_06900 [Hyphomicrobium sp.]
MTTVSTSKLAELIAFKGRISEADEVMLLGIERAAIEVVFMARMQIVDRLRARGFDEAASDIEMMASVDHMGRTVEARHALLGKLERDGRPIRSVAVAEEFPPKRSRAWFALGQRASPDYEVKRAAWVLDGAKVGARLDDHLSAVMEAMGMGTPDE